MKLYIKNMVCNRCITAVGNIFGDLNIAVSSIRLGEVETEDELSAKELQLLDTQLRAGGFELLEDSAKRQIEKTKTVIIKEINALDIPDDFVLSKFLSNQLHKEYSAVSKLFSQSENVTLEQYFILQKIEKVKELLLYNEFSLTEISAKLGYRSVQHLSSQFKSITGYTPSTFKKLKINNRIPLDKI